MVSYPRMKRFLRYRVARLAFVAALLSFAPAFVGSALGADYTTSRVISMNFGNKGQAPDSAGIIPVSAEAWNNVTAAGNTRNDLKTWDGTQAVTLSSNWSITWSSQAVYGWGGDTVDVILRGYLDDNDANQATATFNNLPFAAYDIYVYKAADSSGDFSPVTVTIGGTTTSYTCGSDGMATAGTDRWGQTQQDHCKLGTNVICIRGIRGTSVTIKGGVRNAGRGALAAIQIVEAGEGLASVWGNAGLPDEKGVATVFNGGGYTTFNFNFGQADNISQTGIGPVGRVRVKKLRLFRRDKNTSAPPATITLSQEGVENVTSKSVALVTGQRIYGADWPGNPNNFWTEAAFDALFDSETEFDTSKKMTMTFPTAQLFMIQPANSVMKTGNNWSPAIEITGDYVTYGATIAGSQKFSEIDTWVPARPASFAASDVLKIANTAAATLTMDEVATVYAVKFANTEGKLTLKYTSAPTLSASYWDFSAATNGVAIDCSALKTSATLMSGTILVPWNIDVAGSPVPKGFKLVVTDTSVRLQRINTATWTGGAGDYDATNPKNWTCKNFNGETVSGAIPEEGTTLVVKNLALTKDADWSALGPVVFSADTVINLKGHTFTIAGLLAKDGVSAGAKINNDATATGDFVVNVPEGKTIGNTTVTIAGNTRLVKDGAGTFVGKVANQPYTGGTLVRSGILQSSGSEEGLFYGANGSTVTVDPDGGLDINGQYDWNNHEVVLNGGTLLNNGANQTAYDNGGLGNVTLTADSKAALMNGVLFNRAAGAALNMGGHTLAVTRTNTTGTVSFVLQSSQVVTNGTLTCGAGINLYTRGEGVTLTDTRLVLNHTWQKNNAIAARDLTCNLTSSLNENQVTVTGRFATNGNYDNTRLSGATVLDLSGNVGTFSTTSGLGSRNLTFADGAAITVDLSGRTDLKQDMKVISWTDATKPPESVTFKTKGVLYNIVRKADGLYLDRGVITIFR